MIIDPYRFAAPAIEAAWASSPSVNSIFSESNRRHEANSGGSGTYANAVSDMCLADMGYYSARLESPVGENVGIGIGYYRTNFDASNASRWNSDAAGGNTSLSIWIDSGISYRIGAAAFSLGAASAADIQFAVRRVSGGWRFWVRRDGGLWTDQVGHDPVTDVSPSYALTDASETRIELRSSIVRSGATPARFVRLHGTAAETTGTVPAGFTAAKFVLP